jgi:hypothetical protein
MRKFSVFLILLILPAIVFLFLPELLFSASGVGVTTGKITVSEPLKAGGIRTLPSLGVVNTGGEAGEYEVGVEYHQQQEQLWPPREWFHFEPRTFYLEPGKAINVKIQLVLPLNAKPGNYFAYLEARSLNKDNIPGGARIGVAAAAKLYFTIAPANIFLAIYFRIQSLIKIYSPWSWVIIAVVLGAIFILLLRAVFRKFFKIQISFKGKEDNPTRENPERKNPTREKIGSTSLSRDISRRKQESGEKTLKKIQKRKNTRKNER